MRMDASRGRGQRRSLFALGSQLLHFLVVGGLTVRGHIPGKDGIQAAGLLVEMVARSGKKLSQLYAELV